MLATNSLKILKARIKAQKGDLILICDQLRL